METKKKETKTGLAEAAVEKRQQTRTELMGEIGSAAGRMQQVKRIE